jgi:hypothetical protein
MPFTGALPPHRRSPAVAGTLQHLPPLRKLTLALRKLYEAFATTAEPGHGTNTLLRRAPSLQRRRTT